MKILIIGAKGMLGQALAEEFSAQKPLLWDREEIDITDFASSREKIVAEKPEVIINCAAMTDVDGCEEKPEIASTLNGEAPARLAQVANEISATLVQYSTSYIFDGKNKEGYREEDAPSPVSVYGRTKLAGERGAATAEKHYILRLDRLFGRAGGGKKSFVEKMLELAEKKRLSVINNEYGSPTYAPDLAARTHLILESKPAFGIYHSANEGICSWYEWAETIFKIAGYDVELIRASAADFPRKAVRPACAGLVCTKLPPLRGWEAALKEFLQHI